MTPQRIDTWLFHARLFKSRSLAQAAIADGQVWLDGRSAEKPAETLKVGDRLVVRQGSRHRWLTVRALGTRRGPAEDARRLYDEDTESD